MPIDPTLKKFADRIDEIDNQMAATIEAGAMSVSDADVNVQRLALSSLRTERRLVAAQRNRHLIQRAGKDSIFGFRLKVDTSESD